MEYWDSFDCEIQCEELYWDEEEDLDWEEDETEGGEDSFLDSYWEGLTEIGEW